MKRKRIVNLKIKIRKTLQIQCFHTYVYFERSEKGIEFFMKRRRLRIRRILVLLIIIILAIVLIKNIIKSNILEYC